MPQVRMREIVANYFPEKYWFKPYGNLGEKPICESESDAAKLFRLFASKFGINLPVLFTDIIINKAILGGLWNERLNKPLNSPFIARSLTATFKIMDEAISNSPEIKDRLCSEQVNVFALLSTICSVFNELNHVPDYCMWSIPDGVLARIQDIIFRYLTLKSPGVSP